MDIRRSRVAGSVRTEGGLLPSDLLEKIKAADADVPGLNDADFGLPTGERAREATTRSWNRLVGSWAALEAVRVGAGANDPLVGPTRDRFLVPLFEELGFGRLPIVRAVDIEGTSYPISHSWEGRVPVHLVGYGVELDTRTRGVRGAAGAAPHALVQEYLNRTDETLWGVVSNGRTLRLLRDSTSLTRQAYVEFDLEAIFEGELYADFALLWSVLHRSRFEGERAADCLLERWTKKAADDGTRALDKLRGGVEKAIETLGAGFLATKGNGALVEALRSGELDSQDYYRELLRLVYRLIFLFTAEDRRDQETGRELLLDPVVPEEAAERYRRYYSTVRLRSFASRRRGSRHPDLWVSLRRVVEALGSDGAPSLALPALGSFLFGSHACPHLDASDLTNEGLLDAVRALATIEEDRRLRLVDYRNLGAEELGGIYEGLLELHPRIELDANPPRFSLGTAQGNERKSTGSYYTPSSLINCLLDSALDPVVDEAVRGKSGAEAEAAILGLAIVDPAAGSGHFLIAASHRLAKRLAAVRSGEGEPPPAQIRHALRDVIARCIYAVDINPMAVELCKVSLWLEALEPGRPLSFLDAHVRCGNSLLGATPALAAMGIPDVAFDAIAGDDKAVARAWRTRNDQERSGQQSIFELPLLIPQEVLAQRAAEVELLPEDTAAAVAVKMARYQSSIESADLRLSRAALDGWCAAFVVPKLRGAPAITTAVSRALGTETAQVPVDVRSGVAAAASDHGFFHWQLEFPAVFERGGFDSVVGNPPWGATIDPSIRSLLRARYASIRSGAIDTFAAFLDLAIQLARPSGTVGLVLPDIILLKNYPDARAQLLELTSIRQIVHWGRAFPGVSMDVCTIATAINPPGPDHIVACIPEVGVSVATSQLVPIAQSVFLANKDHRINLSLSSERQLLLDQMRALGPRVGDLFLIREGVHSGNVRDRLFVDTQEGDDCPPLIFGRDEIAPMRLRWAGRYIQLDASHFDRAAGDYYNIGDRSLYEQPKILVRRTGDFILAAVDLEGRFCSNNFFIVIPRAPMSTAQLIYAAAALNTAFATLFFRTVQPRKGRVFAELKITHLEDIPIPMIGDPVARTLGERLETTSIAGNLPSDSLGAFRADLLSILRNRAPQVARAMEDVDVG